MLYSNERSYERACCQQKQSYPRKQPGKQKVSKPPHAVSRVPSLSNTSNRSLLSCCMSMYHKEGPPNEVAFASTTLGLSLTPNMGFIRGLVNLPKSPDSDLSFRSLFLRPKQTIHGHTILPGITVVFNDTK
jgi:hypothetical protein